MNFIYNAIEVDTKVGWLPLLDKCFLFCSEIKPTVTITISCGYLLFKTL